MMPGDIQKVHWTGIVPTRDLTLTDLKYYRHEAAKALVTETCKRACLKPEELEIMDLSPGHFGLNNWDTPPLDFTWQDWVKNYQVPVDASICIFKVLSLSAKPKVTDLRFLRGYSGPSVLALFNLESCYAGLPVIENLKIAAMSDEARAVMERLTGKAVKDGVIGTVMEGYFTNPIVYTPQDMMTVQLRSGYESKMQGDRLVLGGYICERRGITIA